MPGAAFEGSHNRLLTLPSTSGATVTAPLPFYNDTPPSPFTVSVTFQVDLAQQINTGAFVDGTSIVQARGAFDGWGGTALPSTNDPTILRTNQFGSPPVTIVTSNVYVYTYDIAGSPGQTIDYKYHVDQGTPLDNWEAPAAGTGDPTDNNNRFFTMGNAPTQTVPTVYFNDAPYAPVVNNDVTFQVDMSSQILLGFFDPSSGSVEVRGDFNSWGGTPTPCTNNPTAPNTNIYSAVVRIHDGVGATHQYKFWSSVSANGGWETNANNRAMQIANTTAQTLPGVYFDDWYVSPGDVLTADTTVTFSVSMTNAVGTDSVVFNPAVDLVLINGVPTFLPWPISTPVLTNNPVPSIIYSVDILVPRGSFLQQSYKYSIDGNNDEPGGNHVRYIRSTGTYAMPMDVFGNIVVEDSFGNFKIGPGTAGHVHLSWLGRPGVHLQVKSSLTGSWVDHPETDGLSSAEWPISGSTSFFRLIKP
jgi:hypothetical protein